MAFANMFFSALPTAASSSSGFSGGFALGSWTSLSVSVILKDAVNTPGIGGTAAAAIAAIAEISDALFPARLAACVAVATETMTRALFVCNPRPMNVRSPTAFAASLIFLPHHLRNLPTLTMAFFTFAIALSQASLRPRTSTWAFISAAVAPLRCSSTNDVYAA